MSEKHTLLARMTGLIESRRKAADASNKLREELQNAENALVLHWHGFMKIAAEVLNEQDEAAAKARAATRQNARSTTQAPIESKNA